MPFRPILISTVQYNDDLLARRLTQLDVARLARPLGADGVEARPDYWHDRAREVGELGHAARDAQLIVTYATGLTLFGAPAAGQPSFLQVLDEAVTLGARLLRVFPGPTPADDDAAAWSAAEERIRQAGASGIVVALENFGGTPGNHVADISAILDRLATPALGTNVDLGNYATNGEDLLAAVQILGPRIVSTHLRDQTGATTAALGEGALPLGPALAALAALPQSIIHCFEFAGGGDPEGRIRRSLTYLQAG